MRGHKWRTAVTLWAAATLVTALGTTSAAPAAATSDSHPAGPAARASVLPVLLGCLSDPEVRPSEFILACGDGNSRLAALHWSSWDANDAVATGYNAVNDCKPFCAAGKFHSYPVIVVLEHPHTWKQNPRVLQFTQMNLVFPGDRPEGYDRVVNIPLWN
ncbi:hypothetical protein FNH09_30445 [Streptomyces adustus]|uniref:Secreted protein n=1 Tax=Streptomyces adustus TaxID=1609272 RepID=A0A5N8VJK6_9ACTN|nr:hypothetical protein [Streptomyces adustus]